MQVARATEAGDAASALDMLEDKSVPFLPPCPPYFPLPFPTAPLPIPLEANAGGEADKGEAPAEATESEVPPIIVQYKRELNRCRDVDRSYKKLNKIDEGTYGVVYRAECKISKRIVALKQVEAASLWR
eukprot:755391-Hanusia_phi.AAC.1